MEDPADQHHRVRAHWALEERPGVDDLVEYEARVNNIWPEHRDAVFCVVGGILVTFWPAWQARCSRAVLSDLQLIELLWEPSTILLIPGQALSQRACRYANVLVVNLRL
jgi:hypothetical protein